MYCLLYSSIDATFTEGIMRYVNDSPRKFANCEMKIIEQGGRPYLCLRSLGKGIKKGTELRYNYGDASSLWWRKKVRSAYFQYLIRKVHTFKIAAFLPPPPSKLSTP